MVPSSCALKQPVEPYGQPVQEVLRRNGHLAEGVVKSSLPTFKFIVHIIAVEPRERACQNKMITLDLDLLQQYIQITSSCFRVSSVVHAKVSAVAIQRQDRAHTVLGIDPHRVGDVGVIAVQGHLQNLLVPPPRPLHVHKRKEQRLVPSIRPRQAEELAHQLLLVGLVHQDHNRATAGPQEPHEAVVRLGLHLVNPELRDALSVDSETLFRVAFLDPRKVVEKVAAEHDRAHREDEAEGREQLLASERVLEVFAALDDAVHDPHENGLRVLVVELLDDRLVQKDLVGRQKPVDGSLEFLPAAVCLAAISVLVIKDLVLLYLKFLLKSRQPFYLYCG